MERNARKFNNFPTPPTRDDYDFLINFPHWIKSVSGNFPLGNDENCLSPFEKGKHLLRVGKSMLKLLKCMKRRSRRRSKKTRMLMTLSDRYVCAIKKYVLCSSTGERCWSKSENGKCLSGRVKSKAIFYLNGAAEGICKTTNFLYKKYLIVNHRHCAAFFVSFRRNSTNKKTNVENFIFVRGGNWKVGGQFITIKWLKAGRKPNFQFARESFL